MSDELWVRFIERRDPLRENALSLIRDEKNSVKLHVEYDPVVVGGIRTIELNRSEAQQLAKWLNENSSEACK